MPTLAVDRVMHSSPADCHANALFVEIDLDSRSDSNAASKPETHASTSLIFRSGVASSQCSIFTRTLSSHGTWLDREFRGLAN